MVHDGGVEIEALRDDARRLAPTDPRALEAHDALARALFDRYDRLQRIEDLDGGLAAIARALATPGGAGRPELHAQLGSALLQHHARFREPGDLAAAARAYARALELVPPGTELVPKLRLSLESALLLRWQAADDESALARALDSGRLDVEADPEVWAARCINLCVAHLARFRSGRGPEDLVRAAVCCVASAGCRLPGTSTVAIASATQEVLRDLAIAGRWPDVQATGAGAADAARRIGDRSRELLVRRVLLGFLVAGQRTAELSDAVAGLVEAVERWLSPEDLEDARVLAADLVAILRVVAAREAECDRLAAAWIERLEATAAPAAARVLSKLGEHLLTGGHALAWRSLDAGVRCAERSGSRDALALALSNRGGLRHDTGRPDDGLADVLRAIEVSGGRGAYSLHALFCAGNILVNLNRGHEAEPYLRDCIREAKATGNMGEVVMAMRALARQQRHRGLLFDAADLFREAVALGRAHALGEATELALAELADTALAAGAPAEAVALFAEARDSADRRGDPHAVRRFAGDLALAVSVQSGEATALEVPIAAGWRPVVLPSAGRLDTSTIHRVALWRHIRRWNIRSYDEGELISAPQPEPIAVAAIAPEIDELSQRLRIAEQLVERLAGDGPDDDPGWALLRETNDRIAALGGEAGSARRAEASWAQLAERALRRVVLREAGAPMVEADEIAQALRIVADEVDSPVAGRLRGLAVSLPRDAIFGLLEALRAEPAQHDRVLALVALELPPERCIPLLEAALERARPAHDRGKLAGWLHRLGDHETQLGRGTAAEAHLLEAIEHLVATEDRRGECVARCALGMLYRQQGHRERALAQYERAVELARACRDDACLASSLHALGNLLYDHRAFPLARAHFVAALDIYQRLGDQTNTARIFDNLANVANAAAQSDRERFYRERALQLALLSGDTRAVAQCRLHLGLTMTGEQNWTEARTHIEAAVRDCELLGEPNRLVYALVSQLRWCASKHNPQRSIDEGLALAVRCIALAERHGLPLEKANALCERARLLDERDPVAARAALDAATAILREIGHPRALLLALRQKLQPAFTEDPAEALAVYDEYLGTLEAMANEGYATHRDYEAFVADEYLRFTHHAALFCAALDAAEPAFELVERGRAMMFRERIALRHAHGEPATLAAAERAAAVQLLHEATTGHLATGEHALAREDAQAAMRTEVARVTADAAAMPSRGVGISADRVRALLGERPAPAAVVELVFVDGDHGAMLVVNPGGLAHRPLHITAAEISRAQRASATELASRHGKGTSWSDALVRVAEAAEALVPPGRPIFLVPDPRLRHVPLHALPLGSRRWSDRNPIIYLDTAHQLALPQRAAPAGRPLVIGARFEAEAHRVGEQLSAELLVGSAATSQAVRERMRDRALIHFSCHAAFDPETPSLSALELHGGDILTAGDVAELTLSASLVVLSACSTARLHLRPGGDPDSLAHAFLLAGCRAVLSAWWNVDGEATAALMDRFYAALLAPGGTPEAALVAAQTAIRSVPRWQHPYFWAGFALSGVC